MHQRIHLIESENHLLFQNIRVGKRVNEGLSVYTGEMLALLLALRWIEDTRPLRAIICSDSSSSLTSLIQTADQIF